MNAPFYEPEPFGEFGYVISDYRVCEPVGALRRGCVEYAIGVVALERFPAEIVEQAGRRAGFRGGGEPEQVGAVAGDLFGGDATFA